jgi:DNA-binding transcriptional MerR regulator
MAETYTIGRLAKTVGLSRSTLLYYDRIGLLRSGDRTRGNYRVYSADDVKRLRRIRDYRDMGLPLKQVRQLIDESNPGDSTAETLLERHLQSLEQEIESLREQQRQVVLLLEQITSRTSARGSGGKTAPRPRAQSKGRGKPTSILSKEEDMITKERWIEIMRAAGLSDDDMLKWHRQFERLEPDAHQEFLESLGIDLGEIDRIRAKSKG